jgi:hypothetical protein
LVVPVVVVILHQELVETAQLILVVVELAEAITVVLAVLVVQV